MITENRIIIIGDIHGCILEFNELLEQLRITDTDQVFCIGDLIDRGPDSVSVVNRCVELSKLCDFKLILGNHEEKFLRYLNHIEKKTGLENQMKGTEEFPLLLENLDSADIELIKNAYYSFSLKQENITLLHGGISTSVKFPFPETYQYEVHSPKIFKGLDLVTKVRYLNPEGKFVSLNEETEQDSYWAELYDGSFGHIYFGHQPFMQETPKEFSHATGLDTGCVFGGWLSAVILENGESKYFGVKAKQQYSEKRL
jgi:predicted phosphodiesterase